MTECTHCRRQYQYGVRFCPVDGYATMPVGTGTPVGDPNIGKLLLGQFQLIAACGTGATGTVYRARQSSMDRQVAVKLLKAELMTDPAIVKRFVREARAGARLGHPNIATVHLVGQTEEGVPYIVMEYIEGTPLSAVLEGQVPLAGPRVVHIGQQIASALVEAHEHGIVHRDLKPENILLAERRSESDVVKVVDFGIAKIIAAGMPADSQVSRLGTIFGTPHYIAPEQASGTDIDGRADLYSLGCILFQMSTGRVPFEGDAGIQVLLRHLRDPPPNPRALNPQVPEPLGALILRLLAKDRADRPAGAPEVLSELQAIGRDFPQAGVAQKPGTAPPGTVAAGQTAQWLAGQPAPQHAHENEGDLDLSAFAPFWRRHSRVVAGIGTAMVVGLLGGTLFARGCIGGHATASTWRGSLRSVGISSVATDASVAPSTGAGKAQASTAAAGPALSGTRPVVPVLAPTGPLLAPGTASQATEVGRRGPVHNPAVAAHPDKPRVVRRHRPVEPAPAEDIDDDNLPETVFPVNGPPHSVDPIPRKAPAAGSGAIHAPQPAIVQIAPVAPPDVQKPPAEAEKAPSEGQKLPAEAQKPPSVPTRPPPPFEPQHPPLSSPQPPAEDDDDRPIDPYERLK